MFILGKVRCCVPRLAMMAAALGGFAAILVLAQAFAFDVTVLGVSDEALRPTAHFIVFGMLAVMLAKGAGDRYALAWCVAMAMATADEVHQMFVPGRYATLGDWLTNLLGVTTLLMLARLLDPLMQYRTQRKHYRKALTAEGRWRAARFLRVAPTLLKAQWAHMRRQRKLRNRHAPGPLPWQRNVTATG